MTNRKTKKDFYNEILANYDLSQEHKDFIAHEVELLEKKATSNSKPTKVQIANMAIKADILNGMAQGERYTITDLIKSIPAIKELTNQKVSALVKQIVEQEDSPVVKTVEKGKTYFALAE